MSKTEIDSDGNGDLEDRIEYEYDAAGIRIAKTVTNDSDADGDLSDETPDRTDYLVDHLNPTGYTQVLEEYLNGTLSKSYTIGHDVMAEAIIAGAVRRLLKDGHGSTRQLVDALGNVITAGTAQVFAYDAYGLPIGFDPANALTTLLYSGEQTDQLTGLQYLRARYYDPANRRFNRLDPFSGNTVEPRSLHKYLYTHADPVNSVDPTGLYPGFPWPRLYPRRPLPDAIQIPVLGTRVHSFLGRKFRTWARANGLRHWANQENRIIVTDITRRTFPRQMPYNLKPDLVSYPWGGGTLRIYEMKHADIILQAPFYSAVSKFAAAQASRKGFFPLSLMAPGLSIGFGRGFAPTYSVWPTFLLSPPGWQLVTWTNYLTYPGVILYDWVPRKVGRGILWRVAVGSIAVDLYIQRMRLLYLAGRLGETGSTVARVSGDSFAPLQGAFTLAASIGFVSVAGFGLGGGVR